MRWPADRSTRSSCARTSCATSRWAERARRGAGRHQRDRPGGPRDPRRSSPCSCPSASAGGIVPAKFFHEFGITIVAAVLISMFVSFTPRPDAGACGTTAGASACGPPQSLYDRTVGRVNGPRRPLPRWLSDRLPADPALGARVNRWPRCCSRRQPSSATSSSSRCSAPSSCPPPTSRRRRSISTRRWARRSGHRARARQVDAAARVPEVSATVTTINSGSRAASTRQVYVRLTDRRAAAASATWRGRCARAPGRIPGSPSPTSA